MKRICYLDPIVGGYLIVLRRSYYQPLVFRSGPAVLDSGILLEPKLCQHG